jgi:hypothetical protein
VSDPPPKAETQTQELPTLDDLTWDEAVALSDAMQKELDAIFKEYGFKRDERLEEHPTEAFSYTHVFSSEKATQEDAKRIDERIRKVSPHYTDQWHGVGWTGVWLSGPSDPNPSGVGDLVQSVSIAADGRSAFDIKGKPFVAISVFHNLTYPQNTYSFVDEERESDFELTRTGYWRVYGVVKQQKSELAAKVRDELQPRGYKEGTDGPWITFTLGNVMVAVCNSPEYKTVGPEGERQIVPQVDPDGEFRHQWPVVIVRVEHTW